MLTNSYICMEHQQIYNCSFRWQGAPICTLKSYKKCLCLWPQSKQSTFLLLGRAHQYLIPCCSLFPHINTHTLQCCEQLSTSSAENESYTSMNQDPKLSQKSELLVALQTHKEINPKKSPLDQILQKLFKWKEIQISELTHRDSKLPSDKLYGFGQSFCPTCHSISSQ